MNIDRPASLYELLAKWGKAVAGTKLPKPPNYDGPDVLIEDFVEHSDEAAPGKCFVARVRTGSDGHPFIGRAAANGASLVLGEQDAETLKFDLGKVPYLQAEDSAIAEAWLAAALHDFPSRDLVMVGVTGTDGKTTTTNLIFQILRNADISAGMLSTIKASLGEYDEPLALHVTTPEAPVVQRYLRRMVNSGLTHCVLEATSHGLAQHRVDAIDFDVAVVTNITHEHLDYHGDYESYFEAKSTLIRNLQQDRPNIGGSNPVKNDLSRSAVLNGDDGSFSGLAEIAPDKRIIYAIGRDADVTATDIRYSSDSTSFELRTKSSGGSVRVKSSLVGQFNVYNMLAAAGAGRALGLEPRVIGRGLESLSMLSGRMEQIIEGQDFQVVVDFAHTPNALEEAIKAARGMTGGRIITVFGSAGKRDVRKRRLMAAISMELADLTVLTAEDPRTESLDEILAMMAEGCRSQGGIEGENFWRIRDRGQAIYFALSLAQPEDMVLICGKGHEQSMCFGSVEYPWDDRQAARAALDAHLRAGKMPDLGLPTFAPRP